MLHNGSAIAPAQDNVLRNFLGTIELSYNSANPYHNATHGGAWRARACVCAYRVYVLASRETDHAPLPSAAAADVGQTMHCFVQSCGLGAWLNDTQVLASIVAGACVRACVRGGGGDGARGT